jgi:glyoxylase-like metal-dependent hydrolase (beta-lactamase superfamily II)
MDRLKDLGRIKVILGENSGRFPFCNSILIDDSVQAVIDPGAGLQQLRAINDRQNIEVVFNTHVHFDHIVFNYVFDHSRIMVNEPESIYFRDRRKFIEDFGTSQVWGDAWADHWLEQTARPENLQSKTIAYRHEWYLSMARLDGTYRWGDGFDFGQVKMEVIPAPGHSQGFNVMYFPLQGIVYCSDIDLTAFGPWGEDYDQFVESARRIAQLDADTFVTGHESGIVSKNEFVSRLDQYLELIDRRDDILLEKLSRPRTQEDLIKEGTFYGPRIFRDEFVYCWEWYMVKQHLRRLLKQHRIVEKEGIYSRV